MNNDNVQHKGKLVVGEKNPNTLREKLKAKLKDLIRKQMKEISASGAAGGSAADGSAGPVKTPYAFGKTKDPTTGLAGYTQVGKNATGTINEKEGKNSKKSEKSEKPEKPEKPEKKSGHAERMIKPEDPLSVAQKALKIATDRLDKYSKERKQGKL
jgi:hypothetical protein